jgi:hypothetical protein
MAGKIITGQFWTFSTASTQLGHKRHWPAGFGYAPSAKGCGSFARTGLRASATSTHRPLPLPETKARRRSRQQHRRQAESGSNVACRPCSSPDYHSIATQAGFFDLIQCGEPPGTIAGIAALENDTFEAELASVLEHDRAIPRSAVARAQGPRDHLSSGEMNSKEAMPLTAPNAPVTLATYPRCPATAEPGASQSPVT